MKRAPIPFPPANPTEDSVVRPDKKLSGNFNQKRPPLRTDSGIDHRNMNRAGRKISVTGEQIEGRGVDILWWNFVGEVDDARVGIEGENHALHRAGKIILVTEVGKESNNRKFQVSSFKFQVSSWLSKQISG